MSIKLVGTPFPLRKDTRKRNRGSARAVSRDIAYSLLHALGLVARRLALRRKGGKGMMAQNGNDALGT